MRSQKVQRNELIVKMYASGGKTLASIGDAFGITRERVRQILVRNGFEKRRLPPKGFMTISEVAEYVGRERSATLRFLKIRRAIRYGGFVSRQDAEKLWLDANRMCLGCGKKLKRVSVPNKWGRCSPCSAKASFRWLNVPGYKELQTLRIKSWQMRNKDKHREIQKRAMAKYKARHAHISAG